MSILKYTIIRLALFAGFAGLFYLAGMRSYMLLLAAIICAALANYIFFRPATVDAARSIERGLHRSSRPADAAEDDEVAASAEPATRSEAGSADTVGGTDASTATGSAGTATTVGSADAAGPAHATGATGTTGTTGARAAADDSDEAGAGETAPGRAE